MINTQHCKELFDEFIGGYDIKDDRIKLKYDHTFRVVNFCEAIASSLNLSSEDIELAKLIGLLHDVGRFEQIKRYDTFQDLVSADHALLGTEILNKDNLITQFIDNEDKQLVLTAIFNHNKLDILTGLYERGKRFCNIIRDADKLDILVMYSEKIISIKPNAGVINKEVMNNLINKEQVMIGNTKSKIDLYLCGVGFVFDLNYKYSINYINKNHLLANLMDLLINTNQQEYDNLLIIKKIMDEYLTVRVEESLC